MIDLEYAIRLVENMQDIYWTKGELALSHVTIEMRYVLYTLQKIDRIEYNKTTTPEELYDMVANIVHEYKKRIGADNPCYFQSHTPHFEHILNDYIYKRETAQAKNYSTHIIEDSYPKVLYIAKHLDKTWCTIDEELSKYKKKVKLNKKYKDLPLWKILNEYKELVFLLLLPHTDANGNEFVLEKAEGDFVTYSKNTKLTDYQLYAAQKFIKTMESLVAEWVDFRTTDNVKGNFI